MDTIRRYSMLIGGDWLDTDERFEIRSPATEDLVASVAKGGLEHADRAVLAAKVAHEEGRWRRTPPEKRQPEQVRGRPRQRPDPPGPDAVHRDPVPGRLRLRTGHPG